VGGCVCMYGGMAVYRRVGVCGMPKISKRV
jgi:hypothetical protein